jgi:hypothetical protein
VKSGLNKKNRRFGLFQTTLKFFTRVEGGIGGPNPPTGALGSPVKTSPNLFSRKIKLQYSCLFLRLLLHDLYGPSHILTVLETGLKNSTIQIKRKIRRFQPVGEAAETLNGL